MIATCELPSLLDRWREQLQGYRRARPRPLVAMGYLAGSPVIDGLIEVDNLHIIILYDERLRPTHCALRLAGYSISRVPWGSPWRPRKLPVLQESRT